MITDSDLEELESLVESRLRENFHYNQSRFLGQLDSLSIIRVDDVNKFYVDYFLSKGMIEGNIKFSFLITSLEDAKAIKRLVS